MYANKQDLETAESRYVVCLFIKISETKISKCSKIFFKKKTSKRLFLKYHSADIAMVLKLHKLKDRAIQIQPCSAKTGEGVRDGLEWALKQVKSGK